MRSEFPTGTWVKLIEQQELAIPWPQRAVHDRAAGAGSLADNQAEVSCGVSMAKT